MIVLHRWPMWNDLAMVGMADTPMGLTRAQIRGATYIPQSPVVHRDGLPAGCRVTPDTSQRYPARTLAGTYRFLRDSTT